MGICWFCHWGWPKPIADIYQEALEALNGDMMPLHYGPAHVVWEDENFESARWCLDNFEKYKGDLTGKEQKIVRRSLEKLVAVPVLYKREPPDYDEQHPEQFPPPAGWEMVKRR